MVCIHVLLQLYISSRLTFPTLPLYPHWWKPSRAWRIFAVCPRTKQKWEKKLDFFCSLPKKPTKIGENPLGFFFSPFLGDPWWTPLQMFSPLPFQPAMICMTSEVGDAATSLGFHGHGRSPHSWMDYSGLAPSQFSGISMQIRDTQ